MSEVIYKLGKCCDCKKFNPSRTKEYSGEKYYRCDNIVEAIIPEGIIHKEIKCRYYKSL